jgi:hypothetical protein
MKNYCFDLGSPEDSQWRIHFEIFPDLLWIGHIELEPGNRFGLYLYFFGMHIDTP